MMDIYHISKEEFLQNVKIPTRIMATEQAMYEEMADIMIDTIVKNNGGQTVIICPVGPIFHYPIFAEKVNRQRVSLKNCWFINMDEYLTDEDKTIDYNDPLSFHAIMDRMLYSRIDEDLVMPVEQRLFPEPGHEEEIDKLFASFEKIDLCLTGVGINGHIAFNETPVEDITDEEFGKIGTRCMNIATETVVNNGANKLRGALDIFPKRCITLGMKQLLSAKKFKVYLYCAWQWGIMRKITLAPWSKSAPASYLQLHNDAEVVVTEELANFVL